MPPRLLSFLSSIEQVLAGDACPSVQTRPRRSVNYQKGIARMTFADGSGSITLQNFTLADGQICIKAEYLWAWPQPTVGSHAIYPSTDNFDWFGAAYKVAQGWMAELKPAPTPDASGGREQYAAAS